MVNWVANRTGAAAYGASLLKVFWPYLDWNTVFDNSRVVAELGEVPANFSLCLSALEFSRDNKFRYRPSPGHPMQARRNCRGGKRGRMTDFLLIAWVSALIEITRLGWMLGLGER